ncbi:unnamed protein product [Caenorhabditis bovis]|uniref:SXP/RAL-2 family protein Ani s 5-like cation-binding domain-containing protein n=1 Tax=Caenorhabditis bovis TaxID=2654633 RepID=A0A8S1E8T3_9PELO|nr:unnamed protein product [Caenorhabditis bovis]
MRRLLVSTFLIVSAAAVGYKDVENEVVKRKDEIIGDGTEIKDPKHLRFFVKTNKVEPEFIEKSFKLSEESNDEIMKRLQKKLDEFAQQIREQSEKERIQNKDQPAETKAETKSKRAADQIGSLLGYIDAAKKFIDEHDLTVTYI